MYKWFLHDRGVDSYKETGMILENRGAKGKQLNTVNHLNIAWTLYSVITVLPWIAWYKYSGDQEQQQQVQVSI